VQLPSDTLPWASIIITFFNAAKTVESSCYRRDGQ